MLRDTGAGLGLGRKLSRGHSISAIMCASQA